MIDPKDLRKGNYINTFIDTTEGKDYSIGVVHCLHMNTVEISKGKTYSYNQIEPILFTEEWLPKFGFSLLSISRETFIPVLKHDTENEIVVKTYTNNLYNLDENIRTMELIVVLSKDEKTLKNIQIKGLGFYKPIEYVHKFQNLYYELTGDEVEEERYGERE
jgi:hypothetical protein